MCESESEKYFRTLYMPGSALLAPSKVAEAVHIELEDLAKSMGIDAAFVWANPESMRLQCLLRDLVDVLRVAVEAAESVEQGRLMMCEPIKSFAGKTATRVVCEGRRDDALWYFQSIASGFVG